MFCKKCGKNVGENAKYCSACGQPIEVLVLEEAKINAEITNVDDSNKYKGIGGWLIIVLINLFVTLGFLLQTVYVDFQFFRDGTAAYLSDPSSESYIGSYDTLLKFELICAFGLSIFAFYILYLFFKKDRRLPKSFTIFVVLVLIYAIFDYGLVSSLSGSTEINKLIEDVKNQQMDSVGRGIWAAVIWGSYMAKSKRVKATFIN